MRKILVVLLALLMLTGCAAPMQTPAVPMEFYYTRREAAYHTAEGTMARELRDLGREDMGVDEIVQLYLQGPIDPSLVSPFPTDAVCEEVILDGGILTLRMNESYAALKGVQKTAALACLTMTFSQLPSVREVSVEMNREGVDTAPIRLSKDDFLLRDLSAQNPEMTATLYFEEIRSEELRPEKRAVGYTSQSELPMLLMQELLSGPTISTLRSPIPRDTQCLDISLSDDGICTVILSVAFAECDQSRQSAERAVYSIVATLCTLDEIGGVQLMLEDGGNLKHFSLNGIFQPKDAWF